MWKRSSPNNGGGGGKKRLWNAARQLFSGVGVGLYNIWPRISREMRCPCPENALSQNVRSEKLQNKSFPNFQIFIPNSVPNLLRFSQNSFSFCASFHGRRRPEKNHQKSPPFINAKLPRKFEEKIHKILGRAGQLTKCRENEAGTAKTRLFLMRDDSHKMALRETPSLASRQCLVEGFLGRCVPRLFLTYDFP